MLCLLKHEKTEAGLYMLCLFKHEKTEAGMYMFTQAWKPEGWLVCHVYSGEKR